VIIPLRRRAFSLAAAAVAALCGALVAIHYHRLGLTLSHYDARGHLVVARRIADSLTPGWQQIGAVWPPLPHLLNAIPVQLDVFYRTGASAVAISIAAFALATGALAWIILAITDSAWAAAAGAATFALNPSVLYLQATPMTEPLLLGLSALSVSLLMESCSCSGQEIRPSESPATRPSRRAYGPRRCVTGDRAAGIAFALACLTRYEAWPVTASALVVAAWARQRRGESWSASLRRVGAVGLYPLAAILAFVVFSRIVIGEWFVASGFFVPENTALGHPFEALAQIGWGVRELSGYAVLAVAIVGLSALLLLSLLDRQRAHTAIALTLVATAALPWAAFVKGHPYRIRYMVPLIAAEALGVGVAASLLERARPAVATALVLLALFEPGPLTSGAPMVVEAQWDRPNFAVRETVTGCLRARYSGDTIMASMGSLGHYMQELSRAGLGIQDFLHEGNGDIWLAALEGARPYAGWILIEEKAEGGDMLAHIARDNPRFLDGFSRVCEGAGVALYERAGRAEGPVPDDQAAEKRRPASPASEH
jgi:hypothetical protein